MIDKEKAIRITKKLIDLECSVLSSKYSKSHEKVAVLYKEHVIELKTGEEKAIKYLDILIPLNKKEFKELHAYFIAELDKRKLAADQKKFDELKSQIETDLSSDK